MKLSFLLFWNSFQFFTAVWVDAMPRSGLEKVIWDTNANTNMELLFKKSLSSGTGYILIILVLLNERLVPFRSCIIPEIKNRSNKLSSTTNRCDSIRTCEVSPTSMFDSVKLWELTAKYHFSQIKMFCEVWECLSCQDGEGRKDFSVWDYFPNIKTWDLAKIMESFTIHISLHRS